MPTSVYLLFDERMTLHRPIGTNFEPERFYEQDAENSNSDSFVAERPARIIALYHALLELEQRPLFQEPHQRFLPLECKPASKETICLAHSAEHYQRMKATSNLSDDKLRELDVENDLYFCRDTFFAATLACGGVVQCVDAVTEAFRTEVGSTRAIALVRPPGHHALRDEPMGT
jgi:histone deacetylase 6